MHSHLLLSFHIEAERDSVSLLEVEGQHLDCILSVRAYTSRVMCASQVRDRRRSGEGKHINPSAQVNLSYQFQA